MQRSASADLNVIRSWQTQNLRASEIVLACKGNGYEVFLDTNVDRRWLDSVAHLVCLCGERFYAALTMNKYNHSDIRLIVCRSCQKWLYYERNQNQYYLPLSN